MTFSVKNWKKYYDPNSYHQRLDIASYVFGAFQECCVKGVFVNGGKSSFVDMNQNKYQNATIILLQNCLLRYSLR